ncbi:MAG: hypothetical protein A3D35_02450 [Candidatus Staskawiczbacteria bacterium RIFCSPHIGHO2_02_FULL_34_9]|uniref:CBM-cenC domain-containing protein n=1 Tax=Candidatus Staskawiczbacteria bacterium RIFCSPHIGHO2_02_FULL_34_9 TaxID=1802206 RepID=A0A1G2HYG1_9BACT|nr:MAG: hypothetical protein A3D35_02450 [Candidatus Staskawiczbacteria bacterium RIFCSPHIGHO2_02_FULL_34_9]
MINFLRKYWWHLLVILGLIIIYHQWVLNPGIFSSSDWSFLYNESIRNNLLTINTWTSASMGGLNIGLPLYFIYNFIWYILRFLDYAFILKLTIFFPIIFVSFLSSFLLSKKILGNNFIASFISSLVFCFNTYFLVLQTSQLTLAAALSLSSLVILFFIKTLETKKISTAIITGLISFLCSAYEARVFYIMASVLFLYYLYYTFIIDRISLKNILKNSFLALLPILITLLLNLYWIMPFLNISTIKQNDIFSSDLFGNGYLNIMRSLTLFHPFWTGTKLTDFVAQPIPLYFWFIPIFAFAGLIINRKNKNVIFFGIISLLGIFLAKQSADPFPDVYLWLFKNFPGFSIFREASKFYYLIALGYSILIGSFVDWLIKLKVNSFKKYGSYFLIGFIAFIFLWNTKPLIIGEIGTMFVQKNIPNDYIVFKKFILDQNASFRILGTPDSSRWSIFTNDHPNISNANIINNKWKDFTDEFLASQGSRPINQSITSIFNQPFTGQLLSAASIKYVIVPIQDTANDDDFFQYFGKDRNYYISVLDKETSLKKINIGTKDLVVYENEEALPYIISLDNVYLFDDTENMSLKYKYISRKTLGVNYFVVGDNLDDSKFTHIALNVAPDQPLDDAFLDKPVGDCNSYDNNPEIALRRSQETVIPEKESIELEAARHVACTSASIGVEPNKEYLFEFDYQSPNANTAQYYLGFDDSKASFLTESINAENKWQHFTRIIKTPTEVTRLSIGLYAFSQADGKTKIINRYQNLIFTEIKDTDNEYRITSQPNTFLAKPKDIAYSKELPSKVSLHVSSASAPFFLAMSDSYHPDWKLIVNNKKDNFFDYWSPFAKVNKVSDDEHFKLDNFLNGWYIDINDLCIDKNLCIKNSDGSYDINLTVEFWPQRYFYLGVIISCLILITCIIYLLWVFLKKKIKKQ